MNEYIHFILQSIVLTFIVGGITILKEYVQIYIARQ